MRQSMRLDLGSYGAISLLMQEPPPLILTLAFDEATFTRFDGERRRHFPEALNHIPAHATLFHHLPGDRERAVLETITVLARTLPPRSCR